MEDKIVELDLDLLDDNALYEMLKENNIAAGPIVASTRNIYKKKLWKVLCGVADEEEEIAYGSLDEDEEEDEVDDVEYDSKSDTDDDQPSGVSRPVETPSGLKKRFPGNDNDSVSEKVEKYDTNDQEESASSGWVSKASLAMVAFGVLACILLFIFFFNDRSYEIVNSMQEKIQDAANKAAEKLNKMQ